MHRKYIAFVAALGISTAVQWATILALWLLLPLNVARVARLGWNVTYVTHSDIPLLTCLGMALLAVALAVCLWRRYRSVALGLGLSVVPGLLLGVVYLLQDVG